MDKEVLAALRRIATIAHYYRDTKLNGDEIYQAFDGIMGEAYEAIETLTTVMEEADEDVSDEPVDAYGFRADQRLECTSDDAAAFRRNRWMFG